MACGMAGSRGLRQPEPKAGGERGGVGRGLIRNVRSQCAPYLLRPAIWQQQLIGQIYQTMTLAPKRSIHPRASGYS